MKRIQKGMLMLALLTIGGATALAAATSTPKDDSSHTGSAASEKAPRLFLSADRETITNEAGEVVARRIDAYEPVAPAVRAKHACPDGKSWKCIKTERRYKLVCVEKVGGICLKEKVVSWLECVAYDCR
jgi:hypothetical protein